MTSFTVLSAIIATLAGVHLSDASDDYIETEFFRVGMTATAIYTAPGNGRTTINLEDANGGVVLHMDYRVDWGRDPRTRQPWQDILVLNSKPSNGVWGRGQFINDFCLFPGTKMILSAKAENGHFAISVNGKQVATYDYRLPVNSVKRVLYRTERDSILHTLSIDFN